MPAISRNEGDARNLVLPSGFPDEATLHLLVERAPHLLPLAGSPKLVVVVVGREVQLGAVSGERSARTLREDRRPSEPS